MTQTAQILAGPSLQMRLASRLLGRRALKKEGRPLDLQNERRTIDRITGWLRPPRGVRFNHGTIGDVPVVQLSSGGEGVVLHLHGGAYVMGSARQAIVHAGLCASGGPDIVSVEYRLAPENPCPAAVDDALAVYRALLRTHGGAKIVVAGESAGGGVLCLLLQRARSEGLQMPAAAVAAFPWLDLTLTAPSTRGNLGKDMLCRSELLQEARWFAGGLDLHDPLVSALFGGFDGFPPTYLAVGTFDLLLDDARRAANVMRTAGIPVTLKEWLGAVHGFTALPSREAREYRQDVRAFVQNALAAPPSRTAATRSHKT